MSSGTCLLLTSTIQVEHREFLRANGRIDTQQRLSDYCNAMKAWLTEQQSIRDFVFVDNSGFPLDAIKDVVDRYASPQQRIELHSFRTTGYSAANGRSFGELNIVQRALEQSTLMQQSSCFAKATGRVFVANVDRIMATVASDYDVVGRLSHNLTWMETVFVLFRTTFFSQHLLPYALDNVDDQSGKHIERVLASACLHRIAEGSRWYPFPSEPRLRGVRGLDSQPYPSGRVRAWAIDAFSRGYYRAVDVASTRAQLHPMDRWTRRD